MANFSVNTCCILIRALDYCPGTYKDRAADRAAERSLPCAVLPGLEKLDLVQTRGPLSVMFPNLN